MHKILNTNSRHEYPIVIATAPASVPQRIIAFGALVILLVIVAATIPFSAIPLARLDAFVPVVQTAMTIADLLAAVLLFAQYSVYPQRSVLALASGFVFSGLFAFVQMLAFPGAFGPAGLIGDGFNSAGWLYQFWHMTFPLAVIVYALSKDADGDAIRPTLSTGVTIGVTIACVITATAGLTLVATMLAGYLPAQFQTSTEQSLVSKHINVILALTNATALTLLFRRKHTILDNWLIVTLLAWFPSLILGMWSTVLRFTVGWYTARIYALCAGSALLFALLAETIVLYARVSAAARISAQQQAELSAAMAALAQVNFLFDTALKNIKHGLTMFDKDQRLILCNNGYKEIYGLTPEQTKPGTTLRSILQACKPFGSSDIDIDAQLEKRARAINNSQSIYDEFNLRDGRIIAMNLQPMPDGGSVAIHQDITARKHAEQHQALLLAELDHRVKNILARVAVVINYTLEGGRPINEVIQSLKWRIQSMADAHSMLSQSQWRGVNLADLVRNQLAPYTTKTNIENSGPDVTLSAAATQALAMVLQELVTNAAKYGSLSAPDGRVSVRWDRRDGTGGVAHAAIAWRETGGPTTTIPTQSSYGTSLIRNLIPHELGGTVDLVFAPEGLRCDIEIPVDDTQVENARIATAS
jgi:PAS domain S-box-containing protein